MLSWIYMRQSGDYEAETEDARPGMTFDEWKLECLMGMLYQARRGGGTFIVVHGR